MSSINHFRTELKIKIETLETEFNFLNERMAPNDLDSEAVVRTYLERLLRRIARKRPMRKSAESLLNQAHNSLDARSVDWGGSNRLVNTRSRALAAMDVASLALDEAAHAAVAAWLAENRAGIGTASETSKLERPTHER